MKKRMINGIIAFLITIPIVTVQMQAAQYSGIAENMENPQTGGFITAILPPETDSIPISNREDLEQIGKDPGYPLDGKYHLTSDIDLEGEEWTPIGDNATNSYNSRFRGVFDGQGHVIRNLTITGERQYSGLFGYVSDAVIKNIGLEGTNINVTFASDLYAGGLCAFGTGRITIDNCYHTGSISDSVYEPSRDESAISFVGGIIGRIFYDQYSDRVYSSVSNCYNNGDISLSTAATDTAPSEYAYLGGICGWINATISIENCYNTGNVSISLVNSIGYFFAGGICGVIYTSNANPIADCYNTGNISSTVTNSDFFADSSVGGIYGAGFGLAKNCYNTGDISACSDLSEVGGIGGGGYNCIVIDCHNSGNLSSSAVYSDVGGIFGCCVGSTGIRNSSNTGTVTAAVSRYSSAGGVVGRGLANRYPSKNDPALTYKDTFALSDCYNMGKVSISDADPSTEKESYGIAGGILGTLKSYRSISISSCYNTGNLSAFDVGGILGEISYNVPNPTISISNCYWNIDSAQTAQGKPLASMDKKGGVRTPNSIDGTTPLTTAQMKDNSNPNYTGFDFDTVWRFQKDVNDGYPVLQAYNAVTVEINGTPLFFPDQPPVIRDGRTLVPVRGVFEHLGYRVDWDPDTKTVTLKDDENRIVIREGEYAFTVNEKAYAFDVPAQIINDRIMIPFRLILESVGYLVEWDEDRAVVIVTTP